MRKNNLPVPQNDFSLVVRLLIEYRATGISMKDACKDSFYKFQTRLGELERSLDAKGIQRATKLKVRRLRMKGKNRFGHPLQFTNYKSLASVSYLINLIKKLNKIGGIGPR